MRYVTVLLATSLLATATFTPAMASNRSGPVNACKASITEKVDGEDIKMSLGAVKRVGRDSRYSFRVKYTNGEGERVAANAECQATRKGEVVNLEFV